jgi:hypothetical protein
MMDKIVILVVASLILVVIVSFVDPDHQNKVDVTSGIYDGVNEKGSPMESIHLAVLSHSSFTAGHSLSDMHDAQRMLQQVTSIDSCGALSEPTDNWVNGTCSGWKTTDCSVNGTNRTCVGLEASDCCKLSPGGIVVYVVFYLAFVLVIVACSCACCECCPLYSKMCCARNDQPTNTPVVAATPAGNAYDGGHTEAMNAKEDTPQ